MAELNISQGTGRKRAALRVDLTAMVDLAFLLVTFFMLTTTLSKPHVMEIGMPVGNESGAVAQSRSVTLCLGSNNRLLLYRGLLNQPIGEPQVINISGNKAIRAALLDIKQQVQHNFNKGLIILIKPSARSHYGNLVNTLDELNITHNETYAIEPLTAAETDALKAKHLD